MPQSNSVSRRRAAVLWHRTSDVPVHACPTVWTPEESGEQIPATRLPRDASVSGDLLAHPLPDAILDEGWPASRRPREDIGRTIEGTGDVEGGGHELPHRLIRHGSTTTRVARKGADPQVDRLDGTADPDRVLPALAGMLQLLESGWALPLSEDNNLAEGSRVSKVTPVCAPLRSHSWSGWAASNKAGLVNNCCRSSS